MANRYRPIRHSGAEPTGPARSGQPDDRLPEEPGIHNPDTRRKGSASTRTDLGTLEKNLRVLAAWSVVMDSGLAAVAAIRNDKTKNSRALFVLPVGDEIVDYGGVRERRGVTEIAVLVLGDLAQDAAHDLARARLRQIG